MAYSIETKRQITHYLIGNIGILFFLFAGRLPALAAGVLLLFIGYAVALSAKKGMHIPMASEILKHVERPHEKHLPGKAALMFLVGYVLTIALFQDPLVVIAALIVLTYGDSVATLIGKYYGSMQLVTNRTVEGTLAGIVVSVGVLNMILGFPFLPALGIGAIGMMAEYLPLDDNIGIPLVAGLVATLLI